jgi:hypothetical protein
VANCCSDLAIWLTANDRKSPADTAPNGPLVARWCPTDTAVLITHASQNTPGRANEDYEAHPLRQGPPHDATAIYMRL